MDDSKSTIFSPFMVTLLISLASWSHADDQFPDVGSCKIGFTAGDTVDEQLTKIAAYRACVASFRDSKISEANDPSKSVAEVKAAVEAARDAQTATQQAEEGEARAKEKGKFLGWNWGVGVGASFGRGDDRVSEAEIVDGVVRITKEVSNTPRIVLELHNFIWEFPIGKRQAGFGPFAAVNFGASDGDTLTSFGGGAMLGVKRAEGSGSFNIGAGIMLDQGVKVLGQGFEEDAPPPGMETEIRFKEKSQSAFVVFISTTF